MRDDPAFTGAERHLRAVLRPADDRVRAVIGGALSAPRERPRVPALGFLAAAVLAVLLGVAIVWRAGSPASAPAALHISGSGSLLVVTSDDGRRWVVDGRRESDARGGYVIAFPQ